ncbi:MAG: DUF4416 family protein [Desulfatiglans sp.]|nr:DUF4416 family protein [Desulfatiglans sp.]
MSTPRESDRVKLITSLFSAEQELIDQVIIELKEAFGAVDVITPWLMFDRTRYYEKEMGWPLYRRFVTFRDLISPEGLVDRKLISNAIEERYTESGKRRINIDPGYICLERLVLATGKNYTHRIYLSKGIYADLTLVFNKGTFKALEWSYRDYADAESIGFFNIEREKYKNQLRGIEG